MRANVYVDGFNLYYRALRKTPYKWLDLGALIDRMLPEHTVQNIHYFTARVKARSTNPGVGQRQDVYLRALGTIPNLTVTYGTFLSSKTMAKRTDGRGMIEVHKTEEKGSDVNLATLLMHHACRGEFEIAGILSNDSDLTMPIDMVRTQFAYPIILISPVASPNNSLRQAATEVRRLDTKALSNCQFADVLTDSRGTFHKPPGW